MPTAPVSLMPALRRVITGRAADRSDSDLLAAFVDDRDPEAFAALVRRHGPMVLGVCRRVVRDPDAADDAFQAVFLVLARRAGEVRPRSRVGGWLYGVAYKTALKARAVRARRRTRESQVDAFPEPAAPPAAAGWDDLKPVLDEELARLPDRLRVPVVLCDLEGRPQRAVAGQLGIAPATLAGRLADARRTLAARLTRRGVTLSAPALAALLAERGAAGVVNPALAAGVVKAAEAVAAGGAAVGLVSANALQLCDGVMRMIFLTKLKTAAASAVAVLVLVGGVGPGLVPALAQDDSTATPAAKAGPKASADAAFLDRICQELRGSKATPVEHTYFAADGDADKRHKVTNWLLADPAVKAHLARGGAGTADKLDVWRHELHFDTVVDSDLHSLSFTLGKQVTADHTPAVTGLAFSPDGRALAVERPAEATWVELYNSGTGKLDTLHRRVRLAADPKAEPAVVGEVADFLVAGQDGKTTAGQTVQGRLVDATGREKRVEVVVDADTLPAQIRTKTAPGEPIRVRVGAAESDGRGGVKYKVETPPAAPAKKADGEAPRNFFYYLAPTDGKGAGVYSGRYEFKLATPADAAKGGTGQPTPTPRAQVLLTQPTGKDTKAPATPAAAGGVVRVWDTVVAKDTDAAFLRRAVTEARGTPPTALEERYFATDPDPRKREKLLDALLSDPAALGRVGRAWKQRMLAPPAAPQRLSVPYNPQGTADFDLILPHPGAQPKGAKDALLQYRTVQPKGTVDPNLPYLLVQPKGGKTEVVPLPPAKDVLAPKGLIELVDPPATRDGAPKARGELLTQPPGKDLIKERVVTPPATVTKAATARLVAVSADRWSRLVTDLISVGKTDEQILEALTLAAAGRLPTDVEKRLTLATLPTSGDRAATWAAVARALAGSTSSATPVPAPPPLPKSKQ